MVVRSAAFGRKVAPLTHSLEHNVILVCHQAFGHHFTNRDIHYQHY